MGDRLTITPSESVEVRRSDSELLEVAGTWGPDGSPPPKHYHPSQDEHFEVLEGAVQVVVGGEERRHEAGETFGVPAGTVHQMGGDGPARVRWEVRPALNTARFFEELYEGVPMQDPAAFLARYAAEFRLAAG